MVLDYTENTTQKQIGLDLEYPGEVDAKGIFKPEMTIAHLYDPETQEVVAIGIAALHHKDQFKRTTGRKIAFERAVEELTQGMNPVVQKEVRSTLWQSFLSKVRIR